MNKFLTELDKTNPAEAGILTARQQAAMVTELQEAFLRLSDHAWLGKSYNKLTPEDERLCLDFIKANGYLDKDGFDKAVNRMFLDKVDKPKNWKIICELLSCANTSVER